MVIEFLTSPFRLAKGLADAEGRLLGESSAPQDASAVDIDWRRCPYAGSRHGRPMNASALRQILRHQDAIVRLTAAFRSEFVSRYGDAPMTAADVFSLAFMAALMPFYSTVRSIAPVASGAIPVPMAALYKVCSGVFPAAGHLLITQVAAGSLLPPAGVEALIAHVEANRLFESRHGVCAAAPRLLQELLTILLAGTPREGSGELGRLIPDLDEFFDYASASTRLEFAKQIFQVHASHLDGWLYEALRAGAASPDSGGRTGAVLARALGTLSARQSRGIGRLMFGDARDHIRDRVAGLFWRQMEKLRGSRGAGLPPLRDLDGFSDADALAVRSGLKAACWDIDRSVSDRLVEAFVRHVHLERRVAVVIERLQRDIDDSLRRPPGRPILDGGSIARAYGPTLRDSIGEWLDVTVTFDATGVTVGSGA